MRALTVTPPWLELAFEELNFDIAEEPGPADNPRIAEYFEATTYPTTDDEVPWCSAFVNWCVLNAGYYPTHSAAARSWLKWGRKLESPTPKATSACSLVSPPSGPTCSGATSRTAFP
jgi:uncharacterized protein (TIGR02594 family)